MNSTKKVLKTFSFFPFITGVSPESYSADFPNTLPFILGWNDQLEMAVQLPDEKGLIENTLEKTYKRGSILGTEMGHSTIGKAYTNDFLNFIYSVLGTTNLKNKRILEVGCGTGYLLTLLKENGASVIGIEPGFEDHGDLDKDITIISDTFPTPKLNAGDFDCIIHYGVLEHIQKPDTFLEKSTQLLSSEGTVIFSVPNCTYLYRSGDLSALLHQHWNYFTPRALKKLGESVELGLIKLQHAGFGGGLYGCYTQGTKDDVTKIPKNRFEPDALRSKIETATDTLQQYFETLSAKKRSLGVYVPERIINYLHLLKPEINIRFFDDDRTKRKQFCPPIKIPFENRVDFLQQPTDELLVMSRSFGKKLVSELKQNPAVENTIFTLLEELLGS